MKKLTLFPESPRDFSAVLASTLEQAWIDTNLPDLHQCPWGCGLDQRPAYHVPHCKYMEVDWSIAVAVADQVLIDPSVRRPNGQMDPDKVRQRAGTIVPGNVGEAATSLLTDAIRVRILNPFSRIDNGRHRIAAMLAQGHSNLGVPVIHI